MELFGPGWPCLETGIVNLRDGTVFRGVIWRRRGGFLVLRNAELLKGREATPVVGEVLVPEREVVFVQLPAAKLE